MLLCDGDYCIDYKKATEVRAASRILDQGGELGNLKM